VIFRKHIIAAEYPTKGCASLMKERLASEDAAANAAHTAASSPPPPAHQPSESNTGT